MSTKYRIQLIRDAIASVKTRAVKAELDMKLMTLAELRLDIIALEQCLAIETNMALKELDEDKALIAEFEAMLKPSKLKLVA